MTQPFAVNDPVLAETEAGSFAGRVVQAREATDRDDAVVQILTEPEGILITVYARNCRPDTRNGAAA